MSAAETLRCFVAVQAGVLITEGLRVALRDLRESAEKSGWRVSWTQPEGWHVTLKFLGDVDADRVAEVASRSGYAGYPFIVNVQGDEPLLKEAHLRSAIELAREGGWDVGTCATPLLDDEARKDPSVIKVARAASGRALYFSRAPIPYKRDDRPSRDELGREPFLRHIGIYAYTRSALEDWVAFAPSPLERLESLEQLRPIESGLRIGVAVVGAADPGVDTPADVLRIEEKLSQMGVTTLA